MLELEWRTVPNWERYLVSNYGSVFSLDKHNFLVPFGKGSSDGRATIMLKTGQSWQHYNPGILVLLAFIGSCPEGMQICHYDDNSWNNRLDNVRWDTDVANKADRARNGIECGSPQGEAAYCIVKLTEAQVLEAIELRNSGWFYKDIAECYGVNRRTISLAVNGKTWAYLAKDQTGILLPKVD